VTSFRSNLSRENAGLTFWLPICTDASPSITQLIVEAVRVSGQMGGGRYVGRTLPAEEWGAAATPILPMCPVSE
jgi:hypothetical protein